MTTSDPFALLVPAPMLADVIAQARAALPAECCGLLAGTVADGVGTAALRIPLTNALASPTEFASEPREMLAAQKAWRAAGLELLAVYHSHPASDPVPSRKDIERNGWGSAVMCVIVGLANDEADVRAWWLTEGGCRPAAWSTGQAT